MASPNDASPAPMSRAGSLSVPGSAPVPKASDGLSRKGSAARLRDEVEQEGGSGTVSPVGAGRGKRRTPIDRAKYDAEGKLRLVPDRLLRCRYHCFHQSGLPA